MLPVRFWFTNIDVHHVLRTFHRRATLRTQRPGDDWSDWFVLDCSTDSSGISSRATYSGLVDTLATARLHGALTQAHFSPWRAPGTLRAALRGLISESMPGSHPHRQLLSQFKRVNREWSYSHDPRASWSLHLSPRKSLSSTPLGHTRQHGCFIQRHNDRPRATIF